MSSLLEFLLVTIFCIDKNSNNLLDLCSKQGSLQNQKGLLWASLCNLGPFIVRFCLGMFDILKYFLMGSNSSCSRK